MQIIEAFKVVSQGGLKKLPVRTLRPQFDSPFLWTDKRYAPELNLRELASELRVHARNQAELLGFLFDQSNKLVKFKLPIRKRYLMLELLASHAAPLINATFNQSRKEEGVPESEGRRHSLDKLLQVIGNLITGYQQVFSHDYNLPKYRYALVRDRLRLCGFRLLELIYTEQRFCALRYQVFTGQRWRDLNQLFFILWHYEGVEVPMKLLGCLNLHLRESDRVNRSNGKTVTPKQLYIAIQLFGIADIFTWPAAFVQVADSYLQMLEPKITMKPDVEGSLPSGHLLTLFAWDRPAMYLRRGAGHDGLQIDISELKRQVNSDYANLFSLSPEEAIRKISPPLSVLTAEERGLFIEYMSNKLQPRQRRDNREDINRFTDLSILYGFMNGYNKLSNNTNPDKDLSLSDMLAGRSSHLADDSRDVKHGQWFVVNNSQGGVQIKTKESRYLTPMEVGQLAFYHKLVDDSETYELGFVGRLMRLGQGEVAVTIIKLASYVEPVAVQSALLHKTGGALPGFLVRSRQGRWQLIVHARQSREIEIGPMFVRRNKKLISITLANVASRHQEFTVFNLHATNSVA